MRWKRLGLVGVAALGAAVGTGGTFGSGEQVGFDPTTVTVGEGDGHAVVTVARSACETGGFRLAWDAPRTSTNQSTADEDDDYWGASADIVWNRCDGEGRDTRVFTVPIIDDDEAEETETIQMSIAAGRTSTSSTQPLPAVDPDGEIHIVDNDQLQLATTDVRVREADRVARVTVQRRRGGEPDAGDEPMSLSWETIAGSARAVADYTPQDAGALEIPAGQSSATVTVPIKADAAVERDEDFTVRFTWGDREARSKVTIADSTPRPEQAADKPVIVISPRALQQSSKGPCVSKRRFTVRLRGVRRGTVTLDGKALETRRRGGSLTATVNLRGRLKGEYALKVAGRTARGKKVTQTRRYRTCSPKRR